MSRRPRRNHSPALQARVALEAALGVVTLREPAGQIGLPANPSKAVVTMMTNAFLTPLSYSCYREATRAEDLVGRLG